MGFRHLHGGERDMKERYQRLTWGHGRNSFLAVRAGRYSLWRGHDHLLLVNNLAYTEEYKRFYFRDIQAFTLRRKGIWSWDNVLVVLIIAGLVVGTANLIAALSGSYEWERMMPVNMVLITLLGLFPLLINLTLGPTCIVHIRTSVQTEELPVGRVRRARKLLPQIASWIEAVQGPLSSEMRQFPPSTSSIRQPGGSPPLLPVAEVSAFRATYHSATFLLITAHGVLNLFGTIMNGLPFLLLDAGLTLGFCFAGIMALIRQRTHEIKPSLKGLTWAALIYGFVIYTGYSALAGIASFMSASANAQPDVNGWIQYAATLSPLEATWFLVMRIFYAVASLTLGLAGLVVLTRPAELSPPPVPGEEGQGS